MADDGWDDAEFGLPVAPAAVPSPAASAPASDPSPGGAAPLTIHGHDPAPPAPAQPSTPSDGWSDAEFGLPPADAAAAAAQGQGPLANTADDGWLSGAAKGAATGVIKGLAHIPGWVGDVDDLSTFLAAGAASLFDNRPASAIYQDMKAKDAARNAALPLPMRSPGAMLPNAAQVAAPVLKDTGEYKPTSELGQVAQAGVEAAAGGLGPGAGGLTKGATLGSALLSTAKQAPLNALAGAAGQGVTDATGNPYLGLGASIALPGAADAAGAVAKKVMSPALETVPIIGRAFPNQNEIDVGNRVIHSASDPQKVRDFAQTGLTPEGDALNLPGASPTTGAVLADPGLLNVQRQMLRDPNAGMLQHAEGQNAAQLAGLQSIASDAADAMRPSQYLQQQSDALDRAADLAHARILQHAQDIAAAHGLAATAGNGADANGAVLKGALDAVRARDAAADAGRVGQAQGAAQALGQGNAPEINGATIRAAQEAGAAKAASLRSSLYDPKTLDPDGNLALAMKPATDAAQAVGKQIDPLGAPVSADVSRILAKVQGLPDVLPYKSVNAVDQDITQAMASERRANGKSNDYRLLSMLKGGVMDTINDAVDNAHAFHQSAAPASEMAQPQTIASGLQGWADNLMAERQAFLDQRARRDSGAIAVGNAAGSSTPVSRISRTTGQSSRGPADFAGGSGNAAPPLQPSVDPGFPARLAAAKAAHAEYAQTYKQGPVGADLATNGFAGQYRTGDGALAGRAFPAGPGGYDVMRARIKANAGDATGLAALQDQATAPLRAKLDDGMLPQGAIDAWRQKHGGALRALDEAVPGFSSRFDAAGAAHSAVESARANAVDATAPFDKPTGLIPRSAVQVGPGGYGTLRSLFSTAGNNPAVIGAVKDTLAEPLRRALTPDGTVASSALAKWKSDYGPAIKAVDEVSPGYSSGFDSAAKATDILTRAGAAREKVRDEFQQSAGAKLLGKTDPVEAQNEIMGMIRDGRNGPTKLRQLMAQTAGDPDAQEGVRKLARDAIIRQMQNTSEAGVSGDKKVSNAAVSRLVANNRPALEAIFPRDAVNRIGQVAQSLELNNRDVTAGTIKASAADRARDISHAIGDKLAHSSAVHGGIGAVLGEQLLEHMHNPAVLATAGSGAAALYALNRLRSKGQAVQDVMFHDAIKNPLLAQRYVTRAMDAGELNGHAKAVASMVRRALISTPIVKGAMSGR